jgi:hypothetical protein
MVEAELPERRARALLSTLVEQILFACGATVPEGLSSVIA